ncbi:carbohydrate binding family 9 domain-containing protein [Rhodocaloribacter litoris]|uniref:carbohydrate binding family 9 domain-containing protein n=1 Tax=Rhodocaloribacter litoris TaxID=2558931 RepID=UPI00141F2D20|nr:carbohydrate binding family 9 domain-containing protein [Rhodocaloribacter litoris]QXD16786.1 carbohydrate binding family 9 domain-containing protein [Rhodocaloribacter litoris]
MTSLCYRRLAACLVLAVASFLPSLAQTTRSPVPHQLADSGTFTPNVRPVLAPRPAPAPIRIDGVLDDAGWQEAVRATNFSETFPGDQTRPPIGIEVWTTYDAENLYVAFLIQDDPKAVRVNMSDRDRIWQDDYVGVILDTYGTNAWAYFIASNPIGIQGDTRIINGGDEDDGFDIIFHSDGQVTGTGYQVEMAIPFRSLRFPARPVQSWNINFWITRPRESRNTYSWAAIDRDDPCWLCQLGRIEGIEGAAPAGRLELLPAITGSQAGTLASEARPADGLAQGRLTVDPSFSAKYAFSSNLIADVAVNPDFSQIESDAAQVDVNTTFALFFPERRPFFQEGSELFAQEIQTVYTRSINNPFAVAKLTGRFDRTSFSYVGGVDQDSPVILPFEEESRFVQAGESVSNLLRVKHTFGSSSFVGAMVTDRRFTGTGMAGSTVSLDASLRLSRVYSLQAQLVGSRTAEGTDAGLSEQAGERTFDGTRTAAFDGETYNGWAAYTAFRRNARHWNFDLWYTGRSPTFRAANGFVTQNNIHQAMFFTRYTFYLEKGFLQRLSPELLAGYFWNFEKQRKDEFLRLGVQAQMKGQTYARVRVLVFSNERFAGKDFRGLRRMDAVVESNFSDPVRLGGFVSVGTAIARNLAEPTMGRVLNLELWGAVKPGTRLSLQPNFTFARLTDRDTGDEVFSGYILRVRTSYQFTRRLFLRLVTQYNDFARTLEVDPLLTYKVNPFTALYLGSTHDFRDFREEARGFFAGYYPTGRQIFFKLQYLFRV